MKRSPLTRHGAGRLLLGVALALIMAGIGVADGFAADAAKPVKPASIDVVICLDVSNSMDGLIASAKIKLWDIVNDLAKVKPTPNLRVGLYSYGNDGYDAKIGWIRKELDLTTDLDELYKKLNGLTTNGGTEYVTRVCRDAIDQQKWCEDKDALKLIFVCGNEPASQDPVVKLKEAADKAKAKDIIINPIFCGNPAEPDAQDWKEFAKLCKGRFASIDQDHGAVAITTPIDKDLADLSAKLNTTYVCYGGAEGRKKQENQAAQDLNAAKLGAAPTATRAASKAGALYRNESWDLVDCLKKDAKFDVKKVPEAQLSEELKKMTPAQREAHVKEMLAKREAVQKQIGELNARRTAYIAAEMKKNHTSNDKAFDAAVRAAVREQAQPKGIEIPK